MDRIGRGIKAVSDNGRLFLFGALLGPVCGTIKKEAFDENDDLMLLLFCDYLGIPNPISYYMLELLPYVADDMDAWERRMQNRSSIMAEKAAQLDWV